MFRLEFVSNQEFSESEYTKWIDASGSAGIAMPTRETVQQKQNDIKEALHYEFNEQDIERIVSVLFFFLLIRTEMHFKSVINFQCKFYFAINII